jgi:predicted alpha/beta hydrolase family esterase
MKTALIIHGIGGHAGIHWQQWLNSQLQSAGYKVLMPNLPKSDHPNRQEWLANIKRQLNGVDLSNLVIIGHSLGVTTALDFIEQAKSKINGLISVSGFAEDYGAELNSYFLSEKSIDFNKVKQNLNWAAVFYGSDDPYVNPDALANLAKELEVKPTVIAGGGHLNSEAGFSEFPALLEAIP